MLICSFRANPQRKGEVYCEKVQWKHFNYNRLKNWMWEVSAPTLFKKTHLFTLHPLRYKFFLLYRGCLWDNWKPSFLPRLIFNGRTFSRWVTARWSREWGKNQVSTKRNSRNRWCQIARWTICTAAILPELWKV